MSNALLDALGFVGSVLDTPGSIARGLLAGQNPLPGIFDPSQRVSGRRLLEQWGALDPKGEDEGFGGGDLLGLGLELVADPLAWGGTALAKRLFRRPEVAVMADAPKLPPKPQFDLTGLEPPKTPAPEAMLPTAASVAAPTSELGPVWYSRTLEAAQKLPESVKGKSLLNLLKKHGAPPEELEWMRAAELAKPGQRVPKSELLQRLEENQIRVGETRYGNPLTRAEMEELDRLRFGPDEPFDEARWTDPGLSPEQSRRLDELMAKEAAAKPAGWGSHQTPGGESYQELLLTLPPKPLDLGAVENLADDLMRAGGLNPATAPLEVQKAYMNLASGKLAPPAYRSSHWPDDPNVLAHVRYNTHFRPAQGFDVFDPRTSQAVRRMATEEEARALATQGLDYGPARGEKVLHLEEVQSDWHQVGKKEGYYPGKPFEVYSEGSGKSLGSFNTEQEALAFIKNNPVFEDSMLRSTVDMPPNAPFKDTWHELAVKRMLREAAEGGYDRLSWNPGETVKNMVGGKLAGQQHFYDEVLPNYLNKYAKPWGVQVEPLEGLLGTRPGNVSLHSAVARMNPQEARQLANELNLTLAELWQQAGPRQDELLARLPPETVQALKLGPQPGPVAHSLPITPQMREAILRRGQPLLNWLAPVAGGSALLAALARQQEV